MLTKHLQKWLPAVVILVALLAMLIPARSSLAASPTPTKSASPTAPANPVTVGKISWNWNDTGGEQSSTGDWTKYFFNQVSTASGTNMQFKVFWMGSLYPAAAYLKSAKDNLFPAGGVMDSFVAADIPDLQLASLPMLMPKPQDADKVLTLIRPTLDKLFLNNWNSVVLMAVPVAPQELWTNKPVASLKDLKGLKIRVQTAEQSDWVKAIGAVPVTVSYAEIYTALQRGTIDGVITASHLIARQKYGEVVKYRAIPECWTLTYFITVTKNYWDQLSKDQQQILLDAGKKTHDYAMNHLVNIGYVTPDQKTAILTTYKAQWDPQLGAADMKSIQDAAARIWQKWGIDNGANAQSLLKAARQTLNK